MGEKGVGGGGEAKGERYGRNEVWLGVRERGLLIEGVVDGEEMGKRGFFFGHGCVCRGCG